MEQITKRGLITIARKKADWNAIKAEYIAGGVSVKALADKYKIAYGVVRKRYEQDGWKALREKANQKASETAIKKTADAAAANAVKLEKARALLIDKILKAIEKMPEQSGTRIRQSQIDKNTGKQMSVDYDLAILVQAFEKLSNGATADFERQKQFAAENNTTLMTYADLFKRPARTRTLEEIEGGEDV